MLIKFADDTNLILELSPECLEFVWSVASIDSAWLLSAQVLCIAVTQNAKGAYEVIGQNIFIYQ